MKTRQADDMDAYSFSRFGLDDAAMVSEPDHPAHAVLESGPLECGRMETSPEDLSRRCEDLATSGGESCLSALPDVARM